MIRKIKRYGWIPDLPDQRDHLYSAPQPGLAKLPKKVDLRRKYPPIFNRGNPLSPPPCRGRARVGVETQSFHRSIPKPFTPSRLFIYYNEREIESTIREDAGAMIRDGIKSLVKRGATPEPAWPYVITKFANKPPKQCYAAGLLNQALSYQRLTPVLSQLKGCLASGYPFVFGFSVYESFESETVARTGKVPIPDGSSETLLGGHAVLFVGYNETSQRFIVRNSWGTGWASKGYCTFPYEYLLEANLCDDFWTVRVVE